ncbi:MAG: hypothetical protein IJB19_03455 [Clostridia bacterium]|nr:hypothetical protein [Clostridia bacterium]
MTKQKRILRQALHIFICALPLVLFCLTGGALMLPLAGAIFLHESAHLLTLRLCGGRMRSFRPAPFGLCIEYDENTLSLGGEIAVSGAGCLVNLLSAAVSLLLYRFFAVDIFDFGIVSLLTAVLNLLPVHPLDGGRFLYLLLAKRYDPDLANRVTAVLTYCFGFLIFLFASYLLLTSQAGIYPLLFSIFLFSVNAREMERLVFL